MLSQLADRTHGYTGADLAALCRETVMKALRRYLPEISLKEVRIPPRCTGEDRGLEGGFHETFQGDHADSYEGGGRGSPGCPLG